MPDPGQKQNDADRPEWRTYEAWRIAEAKESVAAGRVIPLADVQKWADSLGTADVQPLPRAKR
jgi:predicted transcriptional regulator